MLRFVVLTLIAAAKAGDTLSINGIQVSETCNSDHSFNRNDVTVPSEKWPQTLLKTVIQSPKSEFKSCGTRFLCPETITCNYKTHTCYSNYPDWVTHIKINCPHKNACFEYCFVSFIIHSEVILQEAGIWLCSVSVFCITTWFIFSELLKRNYVGV